MCKGKEIHRKLVTANRTFPPLLCGEELSAPGGSYISETAEALLCDSIQNGENDAHNDAGNREE
jgi:hypothetical protein